jgi:hypothetical protein
MDQNQNKTPKRSYNKKESQAAKWATTNWEACSGSD